MHAFEFSIPTRIVFGPGTESRTGELAAGLGAAGSCWSAAVRAPSQRAAGPCGAVPDPGRDSPAASLPGSTPTPACFRSVRASRRRWSSGQT